MSREPNKEANYAALQKEGKLETNPDDNHDDDEEFFLVREMNVMATNKKNLLHCCLNIFFFVLY